MLVNAEYGKVIQVEEIIVSNKLVIDSSLIYMYTELGKLLCKSNILHITSYSYKKSNLKVTYYLI